MKTIYLGRKATLDAALDALGDARKDWIKNDRALRRAISELQTARSRATEDLSRSLGIQVTIK